ncbi:MAG TPA: acyl-CoA dehydrogenase, partial [Methylomirabilota bacterium]|nr:acyl-CoA dehydrogenase [Methylomirabilota bacterium]
GTEAQRSQYLPGLVSGKLVGVHAVTEPESGSDAFSMKTRAERTADGYRLKGTKVFISNGPIADLVVVFATVNPRRKMAGVSAFLVERGTPGLHMGQEFDKMGLRTSRMGELVFEDCLVPEHQRLGREGAGAAIFNHSMAWERSCLLGTYIGMMQRQLEECVKYARTRKQFGRPIGSFQLVASKIADMKVRLETSRLLLYHNAWSRQAGQHDMTEAAIAKLYISECLVRSSLDALQLHGGYGYMREAGVERELRDALAAPIYSGTSEIQRLIIASGLGLGPFD